MQLAKNQSTLIVALTCMFVCLSPTASRAEQADDEPWLAIGVNLGQLGAFGLASTTFDNSKLIPLPLEGHLRLSDNWGLAATLQYRHHTDGSLELNEFSLLVGPRLQLLGRGIEGLYISLKLGLGQLSVGDRSFV